MGSHLGFAIIVIISSFCISSMCFTPIDNDLKNVQLPRNNNDEINNQARVSRASNGYRKSQAACNQYITSSVHSTRTSIDDHHITDGNDAKLGEFSHMVQLGYSSIEIANNYSWYCGGSLISSRFVLTAANCVVTVSGVPPSRVRLGFVDLDFKNNTIPQEVGIQNVQVHPEYNRRLKENNIALIELESEVKMDSSTFPACLYQSSDNPNDLLITGWSSTIGTEEPSRILQKAHSEAIQLNECSRIFRQRSTINITSNMLCSINFMNSSAKICQGSSGSPLQKLISKNSTVYSIVGVTSFGLGCNGAFPTVFTRVSSYLDWIEEIVWS